MKQFLADNYYHIYNRGVNRQAIFFQKKNWGFFISKLRQYFVSSIVDILAYCLMPNHYHLLVYIKVDDLFSCKVMQPFGTSYTKAINAQEKRVGPLFQGRFKGKLVENGRYLHHLTRYIHLNPVEAGLVARPEEWPYSSYLEYVGLRPGTLPQTSVILDQFDSMAAHQAFVADDLDVRRSEGLIRPYLID